MCDFCQSSTAKPVRHISVPRRVTLAVPVRWKHLLGHTWQRILSRKIPMKRYIKIVISLVFYILSMVAARVIHLGGVRTRRPLTILYYHAVPLELITGFAAQMRTLARIAHVVAPDWDGTEPSGISLRKNYFVAITFDDAFESVLDNAVPVLKNYEFPCSIFVPSGCLGQSPSWPMEITTGRNQFVADACRLKRLSPDIIKIESHSKSHPHLTELSVDMARSELEESMADLTRLIGREVDLLAYPYGEHNKRIDELAQICGYKYVFTIVPSPVRPGIDDYARGRTAVEPDDGHLEFFLKATGSYAWMCVVSSAKSWLGRQRRRRN